MRILLENSHLLGENGLALNLIPSRAIAALTRHADIARGCIRLVSEDRARCWIEVGSTLVLNSILVNQSVLEGKDLLADRFLRLSVLSKLELIVGIWRFVRTGCGIDLHWHHSLLLRHRFFDCRRASCANRIIHLGFFENRKDALKTFAEEPRVGALFELRLITFITSLLSSCLITYDLITKIVFGLSLTQCRENLILVNQLSVVLS